MAGGRLGALDLHVHGLRAGRDGHVQHAHFFFDAAVEFAVVLVAAAGGQHDAVRILLQKAANGLCAALGVLQVVQAELQKRFARLGFPPRVLQQPIQIRKTQRDADAREGPGLRHLGVFSIPRTRPAEA